MRKLVRRGVLPWRGNHVVWNWKRLFVTLVPLLFTHTSYLLSLLLYHHLCTLVIHYSYKNLQFSIHLAFLQLEFWWFHITLSIFFSSSIVEVSFTSREFFRVILKYIVLPKEFYSLFISSNTLGLLIYFWLQFFFYYWDLINWYLQVYTLNPYFFHQVWIFFISIRYSFYIHNFHLYCFNLFYLCVMVTEVFFLLLQSRISFQVRFNSKSCWISSMVYLANFIWTSLFVWFYCI